MSNWKEAYAQDDWVHQVTAEKPEVEGKIEPQMTLQAGACERGEPCTNSLHADAPTGRCLRTGLALQSNWILKVLYGNQRGRNLKPGAKQQTIGKLRV